MTSIGDAESPDDSLLVIGDIPQRRHHDDLDDLESTSISNSYCGEWEKLFRVPDFQTRLRSYGIQGKLRSSRFRSVCWKFYLEVLGDDYDQWLNETQAWRDQYDELKQRLIINPRKSESGSDLSLNNPLSQELESPWNQFFQDNELRVTIKQDVIRTFPEILFFQDNKLQERMVAILFCYCKQNDSLSYKQGMHELLAPLIFVLHCDHQAFLHASEIESVGNAIKTILNPDYIEHDAYAMFYHIMQTVEPWYVSKEISPPIKMNNVRLAQPFARNQDLHPSNVIVTKLTRIQDYLLKKHDPELHAYLENMDIPPQIYGIRWVRLLFGREFPMQDLLMLWDAIFADGISFDLVDFVFVAMMLYIRDAMLSSDYPSCLHLLMKYPAVGDVHYFVDKALYLREPNQYPRPPNYAFQKPANFGHAWGGEDGTRNAHTQRPNHINIAEKAANVVSGLSTLTHRMNKGIRPQNMKLSLSSQHMSKSTSEPMNLITDQSPEEEPLPAHVRKGSTASMSQIEGLFYTSPSPVHSTTSTQSLARLEVTRRHVSPTSKYGQELIETQYYSPFSSHGKMNAHKAERSAEQQLAIALGRIHDLDRICLMCADRMDSHLEKLQQEILKQGVPNEDELLISLAGLKQVRDVLKGTLKPSNLFDTEAVNIHDNHYYDDQPLSCQESWHSVSFGSQLTDTSLPNTTAATPSNVDSEVLPSGAVNANSPNQTNVFEGSVSSGTTGSPDTSPASGGTPEYLTNNSNSDLSSPKEVELKDYLVKKYLSSSSHVTLDDLGQGVALRGGSSAEVGMAASSPTSEKVASVRMPLRQQASHNGTTFTSQNNNQAYRGGMKYHSAPPTPLDTINSSYEDFGRPVPQPARPGHPHDRATAPRHQINSRQYDPNQNTRKMPALNFWGQRSSAAPKDNSTMNKLSDLFKGTFKF